MTVLRIVPNGATGGAFDASHSVDTDIDLLHTISVELITEKDRIALHGKIVDAAVKITHSQFGTMQMLRSSEDGCERGLELLCSRGLTPEAHAHWLWVSPAAHSSCTIALRSGQRAIIPDYEAWGAIAHTKELEAFRQAGIRSTQTTPLVSREGALLGMISTHWSIPHQPSERDLRLLDILARLAADVLERTIAEEALRERERELQATVAALRETEQLQKVLSGELGHRVKNMFAMVTAITSHTLRGSGDQGLVQTLQQRLRALSSAHDILLRSSWDAASLGEVIEATVNNAGVEGRVSLDGPEISIGSKAALNVALLIHELTTNTLKHGSLSVGAGRVDLTWRIEEERDGPVLRVTWREARGPCVTPPARKGFGSRLVSAGLCGTGGVVVTYDSGGLICQMTAALKELQPTE